MFSTADYWKSQGRKFCDFCKCWIADNKPSIEFHEGGKKHKENVTKRIKEIHKNSAKQAKITKKFENDLQNMERAAMAAYLKDVEGDTVDLTAQEIIRNKHNRKIEEPSKVENPNQMPEASAATNPRHKLSKNLPADVDFCDPTTFHRARVPRYPKNPNVVSGSSGSGGGGSGAGENKTQGKGKSNREKRKGKKSQEDDGLKKKNFHKVWYEARSPEGYTYYWHIETNETSWEPPEEGFMTIAEQEEEAKEQALQAELLQQMEEEEAKDKAEIFEEQRANAEREKYKALRRLQKTTGNTDNEEVKEEKEEIPYRRDYSVPDRVDPYGPWQTVEIKPKKVIDLQLPQKKVVQVIKPAVTEAPVPQRTFIEKKITRISTGDSDEDEAPTTFKKRKFGNKSVRKRLDDD